MPREPVSESNLAQHVWSCLEPFNSTKRKRWCRKLTYLLVLLNVRSTGMGASAILMLLNDRSWDSTFQRSMRQLAQVGHWSKPLQKSALHSIKLNSNRLYGGPNQAFLLPYVGESSSIFTATGTCLESGLRYVTLLGFDPSLPDGGTTVQQCWYNCGANSTGLSVWNETLERTHCVAVTPINRSGSAMELQREAARTGGALVYRTLLEGPTLIYSLVGIETREPFPMRLQGDLALEWIGAREPGLGQDMIVVDTADQRHYRFVVPAFDEISVFWIYYQANARVFTRPPGGETLRSMVIRSLGPPDQPYSALVAPSDVDSCDVFRTSVRYKFFENDTTSNAEGLVLENVGPVPLIARVVRCYDNDQEVGRSTRDEMKQPSNCSKEPIQWMLNQYVKERFPDIAQSVIKVVTVVQPSRDISFSMGWTEYMPYRDDWTGSDVDVARKVWALIFVACRLGTIDVEHMDLLGRNVLFENDGEVETVRYEWNGGEVVTGTRYGRPKVIDFEYAVVRVEPVLALNETRETSMGDEEWVGLAGVDGSPAAQMDFNTCRNFMNRAFCYRSGAMSPTFLNCLDVWVNVYVEMSARWPGLKTSLEQWYLEGSRWKPEQHLICAVEILNRQVAGWIASDRRPGRTVSLYGKSTTSMPKIVLETWVSS